MSSTLHNRLPWTELATENAVLAGEIDASELAPRLGEALAQEKPAGRVKYELHFAFEDDGRVKVTGHLAAELEATCQRCLQPFRLPLEVEVAVSVSDSPLAGAALRGSGGDQDAADPGEADVDSLSGLADLVEEELILAIPFLPRHALSECPATPQLSGQEEVKSERRRPFAGLREAMERSREDEPD